MSERDDTERGERADAEHVLRVREGHGANCSSVGSVVDTLFLGAVAGGVVLAAIAAAMKKERVTVVGEREEPIDESRKNEGDRDAP